MLRGSDDVSAVLRGEHVLRGSDDVSACFGDQKVNARLVSDVWKVGIECSEMRIRRDEVEGAVRRMLVSEEGKLMRESGINEG
ncbi:UDP-glycosyltransferase [Arachis hypogaea]|nr:UDP-glycosyltransferase [Arachis hypogaea]